MLVRSIIDIVNVTNTACKFEGSYRTHLTYCQEDLTRYPPSAPAHSHAVDSACPSPRPSAACRRICPPAWSKVSFRYFKYCLKSVAIREFDSPGRTSVGRRRGESMGQAMRIAIDAREGRALTGRLLIRGFSLTGWEGREKERTLKTYVFFRRTVDVACGCGVFSTVSFSTPCLDLTGLIGVNILDPFVPTCGERSNERFAERAGRQRPLHRSAAVRVHRESGRPRHRSSNNNSRSILRFKFEKSRRSPTIGHGLEGRDVVYHPADALVNRHLLANVVCEIRR